MYNNLLIVIPVTVLNSLAIFFVLWLSFKIPPSGSAVIPMVSLKEIEEDSARKSALLSKTSDEVSSLRSKVDGLKEELAKRESKISETKAEFEKAEREKETETAKVNNALKQAEAEKNQLKDKAGALREELKKAQEAAGALAEKDTAIEKANKDLEQARSESERLSAEADAKEKEIGRLKEEAQAKDRDIARLKEGVDAAERDKREINEKLSSLKTIEADLIWLEKNVIEQRKSAYDIQQLMQEYKMKIALLSEKTKEGAEVVASFAKGKEFDEFRRSIHLDEIVKKYEDEVRNLRIKNMELQKSLDADK